MKKKQIDTRMLSCGAGRRRYVRPEIEVVEYEPANMLCLSWGISNEEEGDIKPFILIEDIDEEQEQEIDDSWLWD